MVKYNLNKQLHTFVIQKLLGKWKMLGKTIFNDITLRLSCVLIQVAFALFSFRLVLCMLAVA